MALFLLTIASLALTIVLIPPLIRLAPMIGLVDRPGGRKTHDDPTPSIGGIAFGIGSLIPLALVATPTSTSLELCFGAAVFSLLAGLCDDRFGLHWSVKLPIYFGAATLVVIAAGVRIESLTFIDRVVLPDFVSIPISIVFLVGVTNAINFSDGLDGLAAGTTLLCVLGLSVLGWSAGNELVAATGAALSGALLGFLRFNTHPARIFMGNTGSQFLGFMLGVLALKSTQGVGTAVSSGVPLLLLGWPILDTLAVIGRRWARGLPLFPPDRSHLHHRLLTLGFAHRDVVLIIYAAEALLFVIAYLLRYESDLWIAVAFAVFAALVLIPMSWAERRGWRPREQRPDASMIVSAGALQRRAQQLRRWSMLTVAGLLAAYVVLVSASSESVAPDVAALALFLFLATLIALLKPTLLRWQFVPRALTYVTVVMLVYLDQQELGLLQPLSAPVLMLFAAIICAVLLRFRSQREMSAVFTPLDALVVFVVLVAPWVSRSLGSSFEFGAGLAKVIVLCYAVELLPLQSTYARAWTTCVSICLSLIVLRGLLP